jgi:serine/threonine protein kinase
VEPLRPKDPKNIGPFTIIARLGAGGMGTVFLGARGTEKVAIKVARQDFLDDPSFRTRFEREVASLEKMDSPYIAGFLGSGIDEENAWCAIEFVNGETLADRVERDGPLGLDEWLLLAQELRLAIGHVHRQGIVHRDLKPSNIILTEVFMKLIDFGIAWDSEQTSVTTTGMVAGSPAWLAPEQLDGLPVTPASDLFSAGSVLTFAATGRSPWGEANASSLSAVIARIASHKPDLTGLNAEQEKVIEALLQPRPEDRSWLLPEEMSPIDTAMSEATDQPVSKAREFLKTLRWPAVPWAIGLLMASLSIGTSFEWVGPVIWLGSLVWLIVQVVRFFRTFGVSQAWLGAILAIPGWLIASWVGILAVSFFLTLLSGS